MQVKRFLYIVFVVVALGAVFLAYNLYEAHETNSKLPTDTATSREFIENIQIEDESRFKVSLLGDPSSKTCGDIYNNVKLLCENLHFTVIEQDESIFVAEDQRSADGTSGLDVVIVCDSNIGRYNKNHILEDYVARGGQVVFAAGIGNEEENKSLYSLLGIQNIEGASEYHTVSFEGSLLPLQPQEMHCADSNGSSCLRIDDESLVFLWGEEDSSPLLYTREWENGRVCLINGKFLEDIRYGGLLTGGIGAMLPDFVYPVLGLKTVFLDNFPMDTAPYDDFCKREYGYSSKAFVEEVIWPAFQGMSLRTGTSYTASALAVTSSENDMQAIDKGLLSDIDKWILKFNGELAYASNCEEDQTVLMNEALINQFVEVFSSYVVQGLVLETDCYSSDMLNIPNADIRSIRGSLNDKSAQFVCSGDTCFFPLATEGNTMNDGNLFAICSVIGAYGMVSHAFETDDLITRDGSIPTWDADRDQIGKFESDVLSKTSWLEDRTLSQVNNDVKSYLTLDYAWKKQDNQIILDCGSAVVDQAFFYHSDRRIVDAAGLDYQDVGNGYYLLHIKDNHSVITLEGE